MTFHNEYVLLKQAQTSPEIKGCQDYSDTVLLKEIRTAQGERKSLVLVEKLTIGKQQQELLLCAGCFKEYYWIYITGNVFVLSEATVLPHKRKLG